MINLDSDEVRREVKIWLSFVEHVHSELSKLLHEYVNVFTWSYQDMPGLDTNIVEHRLSLKPECHSVKQKLRRTRPDMTLKIREEVRKKFDVGFLALLNILSGLLTSSRFRRKMGRLKCVWITEILTKRVRRMTFLCLILMFW